MRLIDADELNKANELKKFPIRSTTCDQDNVNRDFVLGVESVLIYADYLPTVDAVPVVRCKDCEYFLEFEKPVVLKPWEGFCKYYNHSVMKKDFCSRGK